MQTLEILVSEIFIVGFFQQLRRQLPHGKSVHIGSKHLARCSWLVGGFLLDNQIGHNADSSCVQPRNHVHLFSA